MVVMLVVLMLVVLISDDQLCFPVLTSAPNFIIVLGAFSQGGVVGSGGGADSSDK